MVRVSWHTIAKMPRDCLYYEIYFPLIFDSFEGKSQEVLNCKSPTISAVVFFGRGID
jgi:hypothetical protein